MKTISDVQELGRYINPQTGRAVKVKRGRVVGRSNHVLFYVCQKRKVFIPHSDFTMKWVRP